MNRRISWVIIFCLLLQPFLLWGQPSGQKKELKIDWRYYFKNAEGKIVPKKVVGLLALNSLVVSPDRLEKIQRLIAGHLKLDSEILVLSENDLKQRFQKSREFNDIYLPQRQIALNTLEKALQNYNDLKLKDAIFKLNEAALLHINSIANFSRKAELARIYFHLGLSYFGIGDLNRCLQAFIKTLKADPNFNVNLSFYPKKIVEIFNKAKDAAAHESDYEITPEGNSQTIIRIKNIILRIIQADYLIAGTVYLSRIKGKQFYRLRLKLYDTKEDQEYLISETFTYRNSELKGLDRDISMGLLDWRDRIAERKKKPQFTREGFVNASFSYQFFTIFPTQHIFNNYGITFHGSYGVIKHVGFFGKATFLRSDVINSTGELEEPVIQVRTIFGVEFYWRLKDFKIFIDLGPEITYASGFRFIKNAPNSTYCKWDLNHPLCTAGSFENYRDNLFFGFNMAFGFNWIFLKMLYIQLQVNTAYYFLSLQKSDLNVPFGIDFGLGYHF